MASFGIGIVLGGILGFILCALVIIGGDNGGIR